MIKVSGKPDCLRKVYLAEFVYFATGEGYRYNIKLVYGDNPISLQKQASEVGFGESMPAKLIPCVVEKEVFGQKYLDNNPEFDASFLRAFGANAWGIFWDIVSDGHRLDLETKMYYNLS